MQKDSILESFCSAGVYFYRLENPEPACAGGDLGIALLRARPEFPVEQQEPDL